MIAPIEIRIEDERMRVLLLAIGLFVGACTGPGATVPQGAPLSPEALKVQAALEDWPKVKDPVKGVTRPFFTTIRALGKRTTASGILKYYGPRDCRVTVVTEFGLVLFDARANWAGVKVIRHTPTLESGTIEELVRDLSVAFVLPEDLSSLHVKGGKWTLQSATGEGTKLSYLFDPESGRLLQQDISYGALDTLKVSYKSYTAKGWPKEVKLARPARLYTIDITFTD